MVRTTSQVTRTTVAYGSRNQNNDCSCGNRLRSRASVVNMNSAGSSPTITGLRVLLFRKTLRNGSRSSNPFLMTGHRSLTSSTMTKLQDACEPMTRNAKVSSFTSKIFSDLT